MTAKYVKEKNDFLFQIRNISDICLYKMFTRWSGFKTVKKSILRVIQCKFRPIDSML
jgi:hypothetical protein